MSATSPDELMEKVVLALLKTKPQLAAIDPQPAQTEDDIEKDQLSLTVECENTGKSIDILWDYSCTVILERHYRGEESTLDFKALWADLREAIAEWYSNFVGLSIRSQVGHLTIEEIEGGASYEDDGTHQRSVLTFNAWIAPA